MSQILRKSAVAAVAAALLAATPAAAERVVLTQGHTDALELTYDNFRLGIQVKDDTTGEVVRRDPEDVIFHANPLSRLVVPPGLPPSYDFLGEPGDVRWLLPSVAQDGVLWPGTDTNLLPRGTFDGEELTWRLVDFDAPGALKLFLGALEVPAVLFDTDRALPQATAMGVGTHTHYDWAFTAEGTYRMIFEVSGTLRGGGGVSSGPVPYCFYVGDPAGLPTNPTTTTLTIADLVTQYEAGQRVALRAVQTPGTCWTDYRWQASCGGDPFANVGRGRIHAFTAELPRNGCRYRVLLHNEDGAPVATSPAVTLRVRAASPPPPGPPTTSPPPGGSPAGPLDVALSVRGRVRLRSLRRSGALPVRCRLDGAGTCAVRAWLSKRDARRLRLPATLGRGRRRLAAPGTATVRVALSRRVRRGLARAPRRLRIHLTATATAPGRPAATRSLTLRVRRP